MYYVNYCIEVWLFLNFVQTRKHIPLNIKYNNGIINPLCILNIENIEITTPVPIITTAPNMAFAIPALYLNSTINQIRVLQMSLI